ncbi:MAG: hypothetical protein ACR2K2_14095 [Mycobacteriales bacterium]
MELPRFSTLNTMAWHIRAEFCHTLDPSLDLPDAAAVDQAA